MPFAGGRRPWAERADRAGTGGPLSSYDLLVIGAGAAGLWGARAAAVRARTEMGTAGSPAGHPPRDPALRLAVVDGRAKVGAKILMSGGTRCNLTHTVVRPEDYRGGNVHRIARVLRAHPPAASLRIFTEELGVPVKTEEATEKIFPADDRAVTVLGGLLGALDRERIPLLRERRWVGLERLEPGADSAALPAGAHGGGWRVRVVDPAGNERDPLIARRLLVCTGGRSYPKTGSDGGAWEILRQCGHRIVEPVPALSPLLLADGFHAGLSGISLPVRLLLRIDGRDAALASGPLLWTHLGASGPAALDLSGPWARARHDLPQARLETFADFLPGRSAEELEAEWLEEARRRPTRTLRGFLSELLPQRLAEALCAASGIDAGRPLSQTSREARRAMIGALCRFPLEVRGVAGFGKAEVTSGGVPLEETDGGLESRVLPGVHFAGEVLHVDGRLGGFNFQWAWSSATVAAEAAVDRLRREEP